MRIALHRLERRIVLPLPRSEVFAFFSDAGNLERITPPELRFRFVTPLPIDMEVGALIEYRLHLFGVAFGWRTRVTQWDPPQGFVDEQLRGPFRLWCHTHRFRDVEGGTEMEDDVDWALPLAPLGEIAYPVVRWQLERIFDYRQQTIRAILLT